MITPLVSICILTYQHENYINDCIKGLLSQTYNNIELLIVDDASTDATLSIIDRNMPELNQKFVRVEVIRHDVNTGNIAHNINELIKIANGEYLRLSAGDDALLPDCVEVLVEYLEANRQTALVYSNGYIVPDTWHTGKSFPTKTLYKRTYEPPTFEDSFSSLLEHNYVASPTILIRKSIYEKYGYYDETMKHDDYDKLLSIAKYERFGYVDKVLMYYRQAQTSVSRLNTRAKFIDGYNYRVKIFNKYLHMVDRRRHTSLKISVIDEYIRIAKQEKYYEYIIILMFRKYKLLIKDFFKYK